MGQLIRANVSRALRSSLHEQIVIWRTKALTKYLSSHVSAPLESQTPQGNMVWQFVICFRRAGQ
jgi:hypothetical protein